MNTTRRNYLLGFVMGLLTGPIVLMAWALRGPVAGIVTAIALLLVLDYLALCLERHAEARKNDRYPLVMTGPGNGEYRHAPRI